MLRDVDSSKHINELSFGLEDTTDTAAQGELRNWIFCRFESYTVQKF
jgi:hypothetical protein